MKIYIIKKPNTTEVYIGQTKLELKKRLKYHFAQQKLKPNIKVYKWLDETCIIELLEEFDSNKQDSIKEMKWVQKYISNNFICMNSKLGQKILDPEAYIKAISAKNNTIYKTNGKKKEWNTANNAIYKANGKQKVWSDKNNAKNNAIRHPDYCKWAAKIAQAAKKEGFSSKEYRLKYSIPDYTGPKKLI